MTGPRGLYPSCAILPHGLEYGHRFSYAHCSLAATIPENALGLNRAFNSQDSALPRSSTCGGAASSPGSEGRTPRILLDKRQVESSS